MCNMNSPGIHPPHRPAVAPDDTQGFRQTLRVLPDEDAASAAAASIAMPRPKTELSEVLAGDDVLSAWRRAPATTAQTSHKTAPDAPNMEDKSHTGSLATFSSPPPLGSSKQTRHDDEDIDQVIDAWPRIPRNIRAGILAMIHATTTGDESRKSSDAA